FYSIIGPDDELLNWWQMSIRAFIVFIVAIIIIRIGHKRIFGKHSALDVVMGIIYGSILSRAITGNSPFIPTIVAAFVLMILHRLLSILAYHSNYGLGNFLKGRPETLVKDGKILEDAMRKSSITRNDLQEALR